MINKRLSTISFSLFIFLFIATIGIARLDPSLSLPLTGAYSNSFCTQLSCYQTYSATGSGSATGKLEDATAKAKGSAISSCNQMLKMRYVQADAYCKPMYQLCQQISHCIALPPRHPQYYTTSSDYCKIESCDIDGHNARKFVDQISIIKLARVYFGADVTVACTATGDGFVDYPCLPGLYGPTTPNPRVPGTGGGIGGEGPTTPGGETEQLKNY